MQSCALFDFNELSYCIHSIFRSIARYSIKRFIILFLIILYRYDLKRFKNSNDSNSIENIIKFVINFVDTNNAKNKIIFNVYKKNNNEIEIFNFRIALILKSKKKFNDDFYDNDFFVNENDDDEFMKNIDIDEKKITKTMKTNK